MRLKIQLGDEMKVDENVNDLKHLIGSMSFELEDFQQNQTVNFFEFSTFRYQKPRQWSLSPLLFWIHPCIEFFFTQRKRN